MAISKICGKGQIPQLGSKFRSPRKTVGPVDDCLLCAYRRWAWMVYYRPWTVVRQSVCQWTAVSAWFHTLHRPSLRRQTQSVVALCCDNWVFASTYDSVDSWVWVGHVPCLSSWVLGISLYSWHCCAMLFYFSQFSSVWIFLYWLYFYSAVKQDVSLHFGRNMLYFCTLDDLLIAWVYCDSFLCADSVLWRVVIISCLCVCVTACSFVWWCFSATACHTSARARSSKRWKQNMWVSRSHFD